MPIGKSVASVEKKKSSIIHHKSKKPNAYYENKTTDKTFLTIGPALPQTDAIKKLRSRSNSTLSSTSLKKANDALPPSELITLQSHTDGSLHVLRNEKEKEKNPDRINLDRRGLTSLPIIDGEPRLRLLSLQHNLINNLNTFKVQRFSFLVFLDIYDNQLEKIGCLEKLENIRVLLMGKNRIKQIEGLDNLLKIEVLDLHGNQIQVVSGLSKLKDLKVLNLAGNQLKSIGSSDFQGLVALQELNLRRNRLKKLFGFGDTPNLQKLFLSNNEVGCVEDMSSIAKATSLREISIDNNPVSLGGDCVSFLVSYLPHLINLNHMQVTEQVRKAGMAWRRNKEATNSSFMDLTTDVSLNVRREEVISNARTNWELLRSQTKCLATKTTSTAATDTKNLKVDNDFILTSLTKSDNLTNIKGKAKLSSKALRVPFLLDKKLNLPRTSSQDTENSQNTSSSNTSSNDYFRLPPILVPILNKITMNKDAKMDNIKQSGSLSSVGPNVNSSASSLSSSSEETSEGEEYNDNEIVEPQKYDHTTTNKQEISVEEMNVNAVKETEPEQSSEKQITTQKIESVAAFSDTASNISSASVSSVTLPSPVIGNDINKVNQTRNRSIKSAVNARTVSTRRLTRASTAKPKKQTTPDNSVDREREQGGDYLIEIAGRHLNIYGQGAIRYIDKSWNPTKAADVFTINFHYVNFNNVIGVLSKLKPKFPNAENFVFKETNIQILAQINALSEIQGLVSLNIDKDGNPITEKNWESYAIFRLSHWGLRVINGRNITDDDIQMANEEYKSLSDIVLWSLPDVLLQPLLMRLRIDVTEENSELNAKKWLLNADPALKNVVSKEALQWKKGNITQEELAMRQKAKSYMGSVLDEMSHTVNKLRRLDQEWPSIVLDLIINILVDYSQLDMYMKTKIQELI